MISAWIKLTKGCIVWPHADWAEQGSLCSLIVIKKARAGLSFYSSINGNGALSKFPAETITQGKAQDELTPLWFSRDITLVSMVNGQKLSLSSHKNRENTMSCYYHNCLGLSLLSNQSTELKILQKGEPSALSSHFLCGRPPARREVRLLLILPSAGRKEVQRRGGGETCKRRQETHCRPDALCVSGPHNHGNNIHLLTCTGTHPQCTCKHTHPIPGHYEAYVTVRRK